ncbi:MAG: OmcA/MtrC family decaheme c-type cytochrome [Betaproteobacteria bacterium]|nr:OmcA/MtrC family decaheme c-type cytochrome [Betaproteobacteria bacterium]
MLAVALAGCGGGGGGGDTTAAAPPAAAPPPAAAAPVVTAPTGAAPVTLTAATPAATFAALTPAVPDVSVSIASPPKVTFSLTDGAGNAIIGFGAQSKDLGCVRAGTAATSYLVVPCYPNLAFSLAKYVPGTPVTGTSTRTPGKWVSYIVTTVPTASAAATATRPSSDNNGTLVDNKNGTYTYTFYRDITKIKDQVAAMTLTGANVAADLGDLTYDPNALHRLTIQISGSAPGTGTNTADGVTVTTAVPMKNPMNVIYDFIPATGKAVAPTDTTVNQRIIVDKASCNECHGKLGGIPGTDSQSFHGGSRYDPRYCVVCHTDQRKYGQARAVSTNNAFPALTKTVNATTGAVSYSPFTYVADGVTVGNFPVLIHRIHKGEELIKKNYNFANVLLNETRFPQDIRNCTKCHDSTAPKVAPQADNYKNVPSRLACGACHDGIDFATGKGTTNAGGTGGHIGGAKQDDSQCALCHDQATIPVYHIPVTKPNPLNALIVPTASGGNNNTAAAWIASNVNNLPAGAIKVTYDVSSVSRNASKQPVIVFKLLQNGVAQPFSDPTKATEIWPSYMGSPSVFFVWAVPQDGITAPADFNASASGYIRSIWNGSSSGTGKGTISGPDANGYYTVTLTGVQVPDSAVMLTGGVGYSYGVTSTLPLTQTNLADYPIANATAATGLVAGMPNKTGGLIVIAPDAQKVATGYTGRRAIVEDTRCNKCHLELGVFTAESFHAGQRNDGTTCSWCHTPNRTSAGWSADSSSYIHAIHAADHRTKPFTWHAVSTTSSFANIGFPGILSNCETCHLPGMYDFSASASSSALPNKQYRTVGQGKYNGTVAGSLAAFSISPYVTADNVKNYGAGFAFNASATTASNITKADGTVFSNPAQGIFNAEGSTLVISPIATACFSCHDSTVAQQHMESNGASIYRDRTTSLAKAEQCMFCHSSTSAFGLGIAAVHKKN